MEFFNLLFFGQLKPYLAKKVPGYVLSWNLLGSLGMCLFLNPEWLDHLVSLLGMCLLAIGFFAGGIISKAKMSYPIISPLLENWLPIAILIVLIGNAGLFARIHKRFSSYFFVALPIVILLIFVGLLLSRQVSREEPKTGIVLFIDWLRNILGPVICDVFVYMTQHPLFAPIMGIMLVGLGVYAVVRWLVIKRLNLLKKPSLLSILVKNKFYIFKALLMVNALFCFTLGGSIV
uniref:hypothetical protein n=1 Tax=Gormaniella terricola TaxID=2904618 RepID=UPI0021CCF82F|nr:hypothetical protein ODF01_mgp14 [Gormaniella terricola]UWV18314.1 hypothetical protein [Gormaniella terricola]